LNPLAELRARGVYLSWEFKIPLTTLEKMIKIIAYSSPFFEDILKFS
jgi:hypothetical protein